MIEQFESHEDGSPPRLKVFRGCEELIWELSSAVRGDEGRDTIIALRCLMMIFGTQAVMAGYDQCRPIWRKFEVSGSGYSIKGWYKEWS